MSDEIENQCRYPSNARCKSVNIVKEVQCICNSYNPNHRDHKIDCDRKVCFKFHTIGKYGYSNDQLNHQPNRWPDASKIIDKTHDTQTQCKSQHNKKFDNRIGPRLEQTTDVKSDRAIIKRQILSDYYGQDDGYRKSQHHCKPPKVWDCFCVRFMFSGMIQNHSPNCNFSDHWYEK